MARNLLDSIPLEDEQRELLQALVEASRNVQPDKRQKFIVTELFGGKTTVFHPGLPAGPIWVYLGDVEALARAELLARPCSGQMSFDVTPLGFRYYRELKQRNGGPLQAIEDTVRTYLERSRFQQMYPQVYEKWSRAGTLLWGTDTQKGLTVIGHLCREAMQAFATALVSRYNPVLKEEDKDQARIVNRVNAVLQHNTSRMVKREKAFLKALISYWRTVSDLVQRQEHGATKEGEPLVWEDGRRVVFQTAIVMFEIDAALSRSA